MSKYLSWRWERVEPEDDEPDPFLHRLILPDDEIEVTDVDLAAFHVNTISYLRKVFPTADDIPLMMRAALGLSVYTLTRWLDIRPPPADDSRLADQEVQDALLTAWFKKYPDTLLTKEFLLAGAIELLQTRAAVLQPLKDVVLRSVHNVNSYTPNVARMYQSAGATALLDEDEETGPDFDELTDTLELELFTVMKSAEESLAAVISKWTHIVINSVDQKSVSSRQIAKWVMDALAGQLEAAADKPVRFTDAMEKELIKASHDFTFRTLHKICEQHGLRMLVVSGPRTGELAYVDRHGVGRPLALFPIIRKDCVKD